MYNGTFTQLKVVDHYLLPFYLFFCVDVLIDAYSLPAARSSLDGAVSLCKQQLTVAAIKRYCLLLWPSGVQDPAMALVAQDEHKVSPVWAVIDAYCCFFPMLFR